MPTETGYKANLRTIINGAKAGGADVLLITGHLTDTATDTDAKQQQIRGYMRDIAMEFDLPLIDMFTIYGSWTALNAQGFTFNARHMNGAGAADWGTRVGDILNAWAVYSA